MMMRIAKITAMSFVIKYTTKSVIIRKEIVTPVEIAKINKRPILARNDH